MPTLSIVIPCYNSAKTLRESVVSCYQQNLSNDEFEIIMVDDGSSDTTKELMHTLAAEHTNIHLLFHDKNRGGGAARNTGIKTARGEFIYCLDSDNLFATDSLRPMLTYLNSAQVDGVAFYERRFFLGTNIRNYRSHLNEILGRKISLLDIFREEEPLLDNFIYRKSAYLKTAGYPEHHGFDTQCFEIRYLSAGNTVEICPDSIFYHRHGMQERSYFERVHASGMFSINFMLIYEELFHLFLPTVQTALAQFPIFDATSSQGANINAFLKGKVRQGERIFIDDYERYLAHNGVALWLQEHPETTPDTLLTHCLIAAYQLDFLTAHRLLSEHIKFHRHLSPYLTFLSARILHGIAGVPTPYLVQATLALLPKLQVHPTTVQSATLGNYIRSNTVLYRMMLLVRRLFR
ncbi:glycosyltransferase [Patescibacteria group bacterium]|nr:glycosyltransferase [Patescibacteria group bacterium]